MTGGVCSCTSRLAFLQSSLVRASVLCVALPDEQMGPRLGSRHISERRLANDAVLAPARTPHGIASSLSGYRVCVDLSEQHFVPERSTLSRHQLWAEILLRRQLVVRAAAQSKVRGDMRALPANGCR